MHIRIGRTFQLAATFLACASLAYVAHAGAAFTPTPVDQGAGSVTPIAHWEIQSSAKAQQGGAEISASGFSTKGWYPVSGHATVMAGLLANDKYKDVFAGDNLRAVQVPDASGHWFVIPWWYRSVFVLPSAAAGVHTLLRSNGINGGADLWVNGHEVADQAALAGAYPVREFDITRYVHAGNNIVALRVHPADPRQKLAIGWVDWNPEPPDHNMGPWRGVDVLQTGPVQLRFPHITSQLSLPGLAHAALTVSVQLRNLDGHPHDATLSGTVAGVALQRRVHLAGGQVLDVTFSPKTNPALLLDQPQVWWPAGMGAHPMYALQLAVAVDGRISDRAHADFGIRSVSSHLTPQGYRQFIINGKPVLMRGAGWSPDMFLRDDPQRLRDQFAYVTNLGLNAIRLEGKLEDQYFYDLADRNGIMILPGWECCDKWESAAGTGGQPWDAADMRIAEASIASEARLLQNHPSVIAFLIGSDNAPPPAIAKMYVDTLHVAGWTLPIIAAASAQATAETGPSGMKMDGPYAWVPPAYWYADKLGGAFGFDSEVGAGADIPRLEDVERMLSPQAREALWKYPDVRQYHASADWSPFATLAPFHKAVAARYGTPTSLADYVKKAQLENYDNVRAEFEAFNARMDAPNPSTGVIFWMLDNAWPSLHWHLFDYYLNPAGAYFGARKANEPVHIQYAYDDRGIVLVNHTLTTRRGLRAQVQVRSLDGSVRYSRQFTGIDLAGNRTLKLTTLPALSGLSGTYFIELSLASADEQPISRNVYWLSTRKDVLDWKHSNWYLTPVTQYADFTALQSLPAAALKVQATTVREGRDRATTRVTLTVPADARAVALFVHVSMRHPAHGAPALPIVWTDNDVTLWPGESVTLVAQYASPRNETPEADVEGWNVAQQLVPAPVVRQ